MRKRTGGFTLVELMVVILVIGILVAVAVPVFKAAKASAEINTCQANQRTWVGIVQQARANNAEPSGDGTIKLLGLDSTWNDVASSYLKSGFTCPASGSSYWVREARVGSSANGLLYGCAGTASAEWADGHLLGEVGSSEETIEWGGLVYKVVVAEDGREWLDRNLGATQVASASNDPASYGWYYQWGRGNDGHQIPTSRTTDSPTSPEAPAHDLFVTTSSSPYYWLVPANDGLWQGVGAPNNPCPPGFRVPTQSEWQTWLDASGVKKASAALASSLKLPLPGQRNRGTAALQYTGAYGYYWSSSPSSPTGDIRAQYLWVDAGSAFVGGYSRASGFPVRAIKD